MTNKQLEPKKKSAVISRRSVFKIGLVSGIAVPMAALAQPPNRLRPQQGDQLVFDEGPHQGEVVRPELLERDQKPVAALARDPSTNVLRDGSRLNRVMVTRVDTDKISDELQGKVAGGVIAYSAICTHTGCDVINWDSDLLRMACPCHESQFDIYDGAKVVGGPAPRPLAMLPLVLNDGEVFVADEFSGRVGFTQQF